MQSDHMNQRHHHRNSFADASPAPSYYDDPSYDDDVVVDPHNNMMTVDPYDDDNSFNTDAIHGHTPVYDDTSSNRRGRPRHAVTTVSWWRRKPVLYAVGCVAVLTLILGVTFSVKNSSNKNKDNSSSSNADNADYLGEPVVGTTKNGPKKPQIEVPADNAMRNKEEFALTIVNFYRSNGLDWLVLSDDSSAAGQALMWLTGQANYQTYSQSVRVQRYALACLYYSTYMQPHNFWLDPTDWTSAENWLSDQSECNWEGIVCEEGSDKVTGILLSMHALSGKIPPELGMLPGLQQVDLTSNFLHMNTDEDLKVFGLMHNLQRLELDDNYIFTVTGLPSSMSQLTALQRLSMSYNLLQGPVSGDIVKNWQQLTHLEMESNYLTGTLPAELGQLPLLYYLYLRRNLLDINLEELIGGAGTSTTFAQASVPYANIFSLWLDDNHVTGRIPPAISTWQGLASLSITNSSLSGPIPTELGDCPDLQRVWLYSNRLTGELPVTLARLTKLQVLQVHDNEITGRMPMQVCQTVAAADYEFKSLSADCDAVFCYDCCTECY